MCLNLYLEGKTETAKSDDDSDDDPSDDDSNSDDTETYNYSESRMTTTTGKITNAIPC